MRRIGALVLVMASCRARGPGDAAAEVRATRAAPADASVAAPGSPANDDAAVDGGSPLRGCVAHTAQSQATAVTRRSRDGGVTKDGPTGSCGADAECIQRHGATTPGDGFARLSCEGRSCLCSVEALSPPGQSTFHFELDAPCTTTAQAKVILFDRCLRIPPTSGRGL
jgi:hypothetical protein